LVPEPVGAAGQRRARVARRVRQLVARHELVVVGYDGTLMSRPALLWAAAEARRRQATLRVVTVTEHGALFRRPAAELVRSWADAREVVGEVAAAGAALAAAAAPDVNVEAVAQVGSGAAVLAAESRRAAVLVLSPESFAEGAQLRPDLPVSAQVWAVLARRSRGPVVLVRGTPAEAGPDVPVVVGVDGSWEAARAAELAAGFAAGSHASLRIVCAWVPAPARQRAATGRGRTGSRRHDPASPSGADVVVTETTEHVRSLFPDLRIEAVVESGGAERVLAHASEQAAVLVLGRRGHGAQRSLVLGSVSARVLGAAAVPVALVPASPTDGGLPGGRSPLPDLTALLPVPAAGGARLILDR
jgi:nucleotide-binding universal stress UspA family protein